MNKLNIGDKVKIIKVGSNYYEHKAYIKNYFVDICKFSVDFGSDDALFYPWELELVESKEDINEKREIEELYSALKKIKNYCAVHPCRTCPLRLNNNDNYELIECFLIKNQHAPINWNHFITYHEDRK